MSAPTRRLVLTSLSAAALLAVTGCAGPYMFSADVSSYGNWPVDRKPGTYAFDRLPSQQQNDEAAKRQTALEDAVRPALESGRARWVFRPLEQAAMERAAAHLIGEHDFSSFRSSMCQSPTPIKTLREVRIRRCGPPGAPTAYWRFDFEGQAFLHHMIRNIMGCLLMVGTGVQPPDWVLQVREARDRKVAAPTFSADGLYFLGPRYAPAFGLPEHVAGMDWLPG